LKLGDCYKTTFNADLDNIQFKMQTDLDDDFCSKEIVIGINEDVLYESDFTRDCSKTSSGSYSCSAARIDNSIFEVGQQDDYEYNYDGRFSGIANRGRSCVGKMKLNPRGKLQKTSQIQSEKTWKLKEKGAAKIESLEIQGDCCWTLLADKNFQD